MTDIGAVIYAPENAKMKINQGDIVMKVKVRALMKAKEKTWREAHSMDRLMITVIVRRQLGAANRELQAWREPAGKLIREANVLKEYKKLLAGNVPPASTTSNNKRKRD